MLQWLHVDCASSMAGMAVVQAAMESALPSHASNKQEMAMLKQSNVLTF